VPPSPSAPILDGSLSLIIPVHNEAANLEPVLRGCLLTLFDIAPDWEIVLVDDGSTDGSVDVARRVMGAQASRLRVIRHGGKLGYGVTVADGLRAARADYVAFIDGDGQFDPADLRLLAARMPAADLAAGWRRRRADPGYRLVIAGVFNILVRLLYRIGFHDIDCGLNLMRREVLEAAAPLLARSALLNTELYFKTHRRGFRIEQLPVSHYPRVAGVRSGARLIPILRAIRDLVGLRLRLLRGWKPQKVAPPVRENSQKFG
jgi:glycosyltransferase involved in cell wall biosynthesis